MLKKIIINKINKFLAELPLYLLLGILCGLVSVTLTSCTSFFVEATERLHQKTGLSEAVFPAMGGLCVGIMALKYPEVLYWGFENVDVLLESRPFTAPLSAPVLFQLVGVKIVATSLCRASGLVGGYYAPSLFIGAATGMAYGRFLGILFSGPGAMFHLPLLEVAAPQAYGLVSAILSYMNRHDPANFFFVMSFKNQTFYFIYFPRLPCKLLLSLSIYLGPT